MKITTSYNPTRVPFHSIRVGECFYCNDNNKDIYMKICVGDSLSHRNCVFLNSGATICLHDSVLVVPVECELTIKFK